MKAPIIPAQFSLLFSSILKKLMYQFYGVVSVAFVANYTACFEEHSWGTRQSFYIAVSDSASILLYIAGDKTFVASYRRIEAESE